MADIDDIRTSIQDMSDADLYALLKDVRQSRRERKVTVSPVKKAAKKEEFSLETMLKALSPDDKQRMIAKLMGGSDATKG